MLKRSVAIIAVGMAVSMTSCASVTKSSQQSTTTAGHKRATLALHGLNAPSASSQKRMASAGSTVADSSFAWAPPTFVIDGPLSDPGGSAKVYKLVAADTTHVAKLAVSLGLKGDVVASHAEGLDTLKNWTVTDGTRQLTVNQSSPNNWSLYDSSISFGEGTASCVTHKVALPSLPAAIPGDPTATTTTPVDGSVMTTIPVDATVTPTIAPDINVAPPPPCDMPTPVMTRPPNMISEQDARAAAFKFMDQMGVPSTGAKVVVSDQTVSMSVSIDPVVDGRGTVGLQTSMNFGANGVMIDAYGLLATPQEFDSYPIVSPAQGVKRLSTGIDLRTASPVPPAQVDVIPVTPGPVDVTGVVPTTLIATGAQPTPTPADVGMPVPETIHINGARLVFSVQYVGDGSEALLVPTYEFSDSTSGSWMVVAVATEFLTAAQTPEAMQTTVPVPVGGPPVMPPPTTAMAPKP